MPMLQTTGNMPVMQYGKWYVKRDRVDLMKRDI